MAIAARRHLSDAILSLKIVLRITEQENKLLVLGTSKCLRTKQKPCSNKNLNLRKKMSLKTICSYNEKKKQQRILIVKQLDSVDSKMFRYHTLFHKQ